MVREGGFREDLYYRLKVVPLLVPPLRERREDILPLARLFVERFAKAFKKPFRGMSEAAERTLVDYPWPGNIRELKNLMERTILLENAEIMEAQHLKLVPRSRGPEDATLGNRIDEAVGGMIPTSGLPFEHLVEELERALILRASYATKWNQSRTAELLNLKRDKLRYRMKLYDLHPDAQGNPTHSSSPRLP
jgi:two-component system response regulator AtoC